MKDSRKSPRDFYKADVTYTLLDKPGKVYTCFGRNICSEGISLHVKKEVAEDSKLSLSFLLYDEPNPISALGTVIWCQRIDDKTVHVGVGFDEISVVDQARVMSYIVRNCPSQLADFV